MELYRATEHCSVSQSTLAQHSAPPHRAQQVGRTILQQNGPNHLGLWYNMLPDHRHTVHNRSDEQRAARLAKMKAGYEGR